MVGSVAHGIPQYCAEKLQFGDTLPSDLANYKAAADEAVSALAATRAPAQQRVEFTDHGVHVDIAQLSLPARTLGIALRFQLPVSLHKSSLYLNSCYVSTAPSSSQRLPKLVVMISHENSLHTPLIIVIPHTSSSLWTCTCTYTRLLRDICGSTRSLRE